MELQDHLINKFKEFGKSYNLGELNLSSYYAGRTRFQLEHFVQNEHDTPERQFLQLIMELKSLRSGYIIDSLEAEKIALQIEELLSSGNEINKIEAAKKQYTLGTMNETMEYRKKEIATILELISKLPKIYTYQEIEAAEKDYWKKRLTRQCAEEMASRALGINPGNIRSLIQAGCPLGDKFLEFQNMMVENFQNAEVLQIE
jgi:hypothetical protein